MSFRPLKPVSLAVIKIYKKKVHFCLIQLDDSVHSILRQETWVQGLLCHLLGDLRLFYFPFAKLGVRILLKTGMTNHVSSQSPLYIPLCILLVSYYCNQHSPISPVHCECLRTRRFFIFLFPASPSGPYTHLVFSKCFLHG